jgi:hypothetical protein
MVLYMKNYIYIYIYMCVCVCFVRACVCVYIYIYIYIYIILMIAQTQPSVLIFYVLILSCKNIDTRGHRVRYHILYCVESV